MDRRLHKVDVVSETEGSFNSNIRKVPHNIIIWDRSFWRQVWDSGALKIFAVAPIIQFSWGSACLAHLYRALYRVTHVDCKEIDGPLTLLLTWAWIRLPFLSLIPNNTRVFSIANRYHSLAHFKRSLDDLQEGQFVWEAYTVDRIEASMIPADIYQHSVIWSAIVSLISFECVEWHASDRLRRQFGLSQGIPHQERDLGVAHGEVLIGPKNQDWSDVHSFWGNLVDDQENQQPPLLPPPLPPLVLQPQTQQEPQSYIPQTQPADYFTPSVPLHQQYWGDQASFSQLLGFMALVPGHPHSSNYSDIPTDQREHPSGIASGRRSLDSRTRHCTSSSHSGGRQSVDSSWSDNAMAGIIQSGNPWRIPMSLIQESNKAVDDEADDYLVDHLDEDEDEDADDDEDEDGDDDSNGQDDEDRGDDPAPSAGTAISEKEKGYNFRADPPRRSANRYTSFAFNRVAKKCKKFYHDIKWEMKK
ncbi:hypothetical protein Ahy_B02g058353 [Arachis hypogaea]|uniref:Aminotransferase-like plant mobile domain-containing protein n=1 Tax=Arachis hypogaea TaxID=3818 RepID=A0A445AEE8_ARAHY|nr:hypothetical protein Ahy_B02g058353 [Arachis hypogaea]